jgi:drug/metabolite transporter (DMT)-like permease
VRRFLRNLPYVLRSRLPLYDAGRFSSKMTSHVLALLSAAFYGAADFLGGLVSRRASTLAVVFLTQSSGFVALVIAVPLLPSAHASASDLMWGSVASLSGSVGVALLYRALAVGTMAVVAPTTAACAVAIPVVAGVLAGERVSQMAWGGIVLAIVAIGLVGQERRTKGDPTQTVSQFRRLPPGLSLALLSGVAIGGFFIALARTSPDSGMWPLVWSRAQSSMLFGVATVAAGVSLRLPRSLLLLAAVGGVLDVVANGLYLMSTWSGSLPVVVTLASLYPASTVLLARFVLKERLNALQVIGVIAALVAITLIVAN